MSTINNNKDPDYDIIKLILILWQEKWIFIFSILLGMIFGYFYLYQDHESNPQVQIYSSKIEVLADIIPNILEENRYDAKFDALTKFEQNFYKKENFDNWKKDNDNIKIPFEFFDIYEETKFGIFLKEINARPVIFENEKNGPKKIIKITTDNLNYMSEIYDYAKYINNFMTTKYAIDTKNYYNIYSNKLKSLRNFNSDNHVSIKNLVNIYYFNFLIKNDSKVFTVKKPSLPITTADKGVSSKKLIIFRMIFFGIIGGLIGLLIIIFRRILNQNK